MTEIEIFMKNISTLRKRHNLTKQEMAERIHVSERQLDLIESGEWPAEIEVEVMVYIQRHFGISLAAQWQLIE